MSNPQYMEDEAPDDECDHIRHIKSHPTQSDSAYTEVIGGVRCTICGHFVGNGD